MTIVKLPLPEEKLDRLLEVAKREGREEEAKTLHIKLRYKQMMEAALSFLDDDD
jgi:hypothetical protein